MSHYIGVIILSILVCALAGYAGVCIGKFVAKPLNPNRDRTRDDG